MSIMIESAYLATDALVLLATCVQAAGFFQEHCAGLLRHTWPGLYKSSTCNIQIVNFK